MYRAVTAVHSTPRTAIEYAEMSQTYMYDTTRPLSSWVGDFSLQPTADQLLITALDTIGHESSTSYEYEYHTCTLQPSVAELRERNETWYTLQQHALNTYGNHVLKQSPRLPRKQGDRNVITRNMNPHFPPAASFSCKNSSHAQPVGP